MKVLPLILISSLCVMGCSQASELAKKAKKAKKAGKQAKEIVHRYSENLATAPDKARAARNKYNQGVADMQKQYDALKDQ